MRKALHSKDIHYMNSNLGGELIEGSWPRACFAGYKIYFCKLFGSFYQFDMQFTDEYIF